MQFKSWFEISQNKFIILKRLIKMGKQYQVLTDENINFIKKQKVFYIASSSGKEVNLSPKGYDSIRVINNSKLIFLNLVGSGQ
jgi:CO dehydrogenase/acetyl-CoA synthase beta subunit